MTILEQWAADWSVPTAALADLRARLSPPPSAPAAPTDPHSEAGVTSIVRLEASRAGVLLFRNNVGACLAQDGRQLRYGLANDSAAMNKSLKSADWIGIRPVTIMPEHVGTTIGQFVSREIKRAGWKYAGTGREAAQMRWAELISSRGGDACFASGAGTI